MRAEDVVMEEVRSDLARWTTVYVDCIAIGLDAAVAAETADAAMGWTSPKRGPADA